MVFELKFPVPRTMEGQLIAVFAASFVILFGSILLVEMAGRPGVVKVATSEMTIARISALKSVIDAMAPHDAAEEAKRRSSCHFGYTVSGQPDTGASNRGDTDSLEHDIAAELGIASIEVRANYRTVTRDDFAFSTCSEDEIYLPARTLIVSVRLKNSAWLNAEVHPHEWHYSELAALWLRYAAIFLLVGGLAIFFVRRIGGPLRRLTAATHRFGQGLEVEDLPEAGPPDVARAIQSFNLMQRRVRTDVEHRMKTLAAISHDLRSPLTSLRLKSEFVDDPEVRDSLNRSIGKMEQITATALDLLRADIRSETARQTDIAKLVRDECEDLERDGHIARYEGPERFEFRCKPTLIARAVRNLIDNANRHADGAEVELRAQRDTVEIRVIDNGPGIAASDIAKALEPFERLSAARDANDGGFGLGLSIVESVARAHDGRLTLEPNSEGGLVAKMTLGRVST